MAVQGISARDFFDLARFAWAAYENIKASRQNFDNLNIDVECLLISVSALDQGHTGRLVTEYIDSDPSLEAYLEADLVGDATTTSGPSISQRQLEVRALRDGLYSVIFPFYVFLEKHLNAFPGSLPRESGALGDRLSRDMGSKGFRRREPRGAMRTSRDLSAENVFGSSIGNVSATEILGNNDRKMWERLPLWVRRLYASFDLKDMNEIRSRFAIQAANLNLFLTRLTHAQLQRQTDLLTLRISEETLLSGNWEYSRDLKKGEAKFRENVAVYVRHLINGGKPFSEQELRRKYQEDEFIKQRREDKKWAEDKIAEVNRKREQMAYEERPTRMTSRHRIEVDPRLGGELGPTFEDHAASPYSGVPLSGIDPRSDSSGRSRRDDGLRYTRYSEEFASEQKSAATKKITKRNPLEASLGPDAIKALDEARNRLYEAEDEGLLNDDGFYDNPNDNYSFDKNRQAVPVVPVVRRKADSLSVHPDDPKRHSFPGIMVSPPAQYSDPASREGKRLSSSASPNGRRDSSSKKSPGTTNVPSSPKIPQAEPMQHSLSASPRVPPAQPVRQPTTPASTTTTTTPNTEKSTATSKRSPTRVLLCDQCNASIRLNDYFWRCATGKCASVDERSYDLCRRCIDKGYRCRGMDRGTCGKMVCTMIKGADP